MDKLFRLHTAAPAQLRQGGELRPAVAIAFASLLMYYDERKAAGEMREVLIAMEEVLHEVHTARGLKAGGGWRIVSQTRLSTGIRPLNCQ